MFRFAPGRLVPAAFAEWRGFNWAGRQAGEEWGNPDPGQNRRKAEEGLGGGWGAPFLAWVSPNTGGGETFVLLVPHRGGRAGRKQDRAPLSVRIHHYLFWLEIDGGKWLGEVRFSLPNRRRGRKGPEALPPAHLHFKQPVCFIC